MPRPARYPVRYRLRCAWSYLFGKMSRPIDDGDIDLGLDLGRVSIQRVSNEDVPQDDLTPIESEYVALDGDAWSRYFRLP